MRKEEERTAFLGEAEKLKQMGFDVYVVKDPEWCFGYLVEGEKFAYFEPNHFSGALDFSTCHRPCPSWGSGFQAHVGLNPTATDIRRAFYTPSWWQGRRVEAVRYANFEEFCKRPMEPELIKL